MHSYKDIDSELVKAMQQAYDKSYPNQPLGPTGKFPEGKLTPFDEGEIRFQIGVVEGNIVLNFGSPTQALGFSPTQAIQLADLLRKHAKSLRQKENHNSKKVR